MHRVSFALNKFNPITYKKSRLTSHQTAFLLNGFDRLASAISAYQPLAQMQEQLTSQVLRQKPQVQKRQQFQFSL